MKTLLVALFTMSSIGAAAQQRNVTVQGFVVEAGTNRPLSGASLELKPLQLNSGPVGSVEPNMPIPYYMGSNVPAYPGLSGDQGQFTFRNVPPGQYTLVASQNGHMHAEYGQHGPNGKGMTLTVATAQSVTDIRLTMTRSGAISGRAFDSKGAPLAYVQMQMRRVTYPDGQRTLTVTASTVTDDLGAYRLYGLPPGSYVLSAQTNTSSVGITPVVASRTPPVPGVVVFQSASGPMQTDADPANQNRRRDSGMLVYYPNSMDAQTAKVIDVRPGDDIGGMNITINLKPAPVTVTWTITGVSTPDTLINLLTISTALGTSFQSSLGLPNRAPLTTSIPIGSYVSIALERASTPNAPTPAAGFAAFDTGALPTTRVNIAMNPTRDVSGHIIGDGLNPADIAQLRVFFRRDPSLPSLPNPAVAAPAQDGALAAKGFIEGDYVVGITGIPPALRNAYLKSARASNAEILGNRLRIPSQPAGPIEVEVVIAANGGQIDGKAIAETGEPLSNVTVLLVPDSSDRHYLFRTMLTDSNGSYHFGGLAPGNYRLFSWEDVEPDVWFNPLFMETLQDRGKAVRIAEGSRESVNVTTIPLR